MTLPSKRRQYAAGPLVSLCEFLDEDYPHFYRAWQDPETQRNFNSKRGAEPYQAFHALFTDPQRPPQRFTATIVSSTDQIQVGRISLAPAHMEPDLGIWIYPGHRGKGYGSEAVQLAADYIFNKLGLDYIVAGIYAHNQASIKVFNKVGFVAAPSLDEVEESAFGEGPLTQLGFRLDKPAQPRPAPKSPERI